MTRLACLFLIAFVIAGGSWCERANVDAYHGPRRSTSVAGYITVGCFMAFVVCLVVWLWM